MSLDAFLARVEGEELGERPDAKRVATELGEVVRRIADPLWAGAEVLDLGSGTGAVAHAAVDRGATVTAVDTDGGALARGRMQDDDGRIRHVRANAMALPIRNRSLDASVHRSVLVYLPDRAQAVDEERRVIRPGGIVSCSETLGHELDLESDEPGIDRVWEGGLRDILQADERSLSAERLTDLYEGAGFVSVVVEPLPRRIVLEEATAVVRAFARTPPAGRSARDRWIEAGVPPALIDEFLARLTRRALVGMPAILVAPEGFLTATVPLAEVP